MSEASPAVVEAWAPPGRRSNKMAAPVAAKKVGKTSPTAVDAEPPSEKSYERGEALVAVLLLLQQINAEMPPKEIFRKLAAPLAALLDPKGFIAVPLAVVAVQGAQRNHRDVTIVPLVILATRGAHMKQGGVIAVPSIVLATPGAQVEPGKASQVSPTER